MDLIFKDGDDNETRISLKEMYEMFRAMIIDEIYASDKRVHQSKEQFEKTGEVFWRVDENRSMGVH